MIYISDTPLICTLKSLPSAPALHLLLEQLGKTKIQNFNSTLKNITPYDKYKVVSKRENRYTEGSVKTN